MGQTAFAVRRGDRRRRLILVAGGLAILPVALIAPGHAAAVIGGKPIRASRHAGLVQIIANDFSGGRGTLCGGGLIAPRVVVTAGHCLGTNPDTLKHLRPLTIVSGRQRSYARKNPPGGDVVGVDKVAKAPPNRRLHETFSDDVALLHLRRAAPFAPLTIASPRSARAGSRVLVAGWGLTNPDQSGLGGIQLHGLQMRVRSNALCKRVTGSKTGYNAATQLCLTPHPGGRPQGTCEGDSGTPLLTPNGRSVLGVVSTGSAICGKGASIFARLSSGPLRLWVQRQIKAWSRN